MTTAHHDGTRALDTGDIELEELHARLRAWAAGIYAGEAAVELLITHDVWLRRRDFRDRCVIACEPWDDEPAMAALDWSAVAGVVDPAGSIQPGEHLPASSSEKAVLALVASLAGAPLRQSLRDLITGLDETNTRLVLHAIARAAGWHDHDTSATVTGRFDLEPRVLPPSNGSM